jgi:hypothetical protein
METWLCRYSEHIQKQLELLAPPEPQAGEDEDEEQAAPAEGSSEPM